MEKEKKDNKENKENKDIVKNCLYYYGIPAIEFKDLNYVDAINYKIIAAKHLLTRLLANGYYLSEHEHVVDVSKAIKFNERLLDEIK